MLFPRGLDVGHLALARAAPAGPEVQQHWLALEVGQGEGRSVGVGHGEVRSRGGGCVGAVAVAGVVGGIYLGFLDSIGTGHLYLLVVGRWRESAVGHARADEQHGKDDGGHDDANMLLAVGLLALRRGSSGFLFGFQGRQALADGLAPLLGR